MWTFRTIPKFQIENNLQKKESRIILENHRSKLYEATNRYSPSLISPYTPITGKRKMRRTSELSTALTSYHHSDIAPPFNGNTSTDCNFLSPYHKYWETDCSSIFSKKWSSIKAINNVMDKNRVVGSLPVPTDKSFLNFTQNCSTFRNARKYPEQPNCKEEAAYPLAYIIVTHKEVAQVERLLRAIYQPQNIYCIHPDKKSPEIFHEALRSLASCFGNVFIVSKVLTVQYRGVTRVQADVNCMSDLLQTHVQWKYVMNLCGQDFPLKTNLEIVRQLKAYNGHNDINGILPPPHIKLRTQRHFEINANGEIISARGSKKPPPHNFTIYFGNAYYAATRAFANYVITDQRAVDLLKWSEDTLCPEEHYWVTLQRYPGVPGGYPYGTWDSNVRFIKWGDVTKHPSCIGKYVRAVCVFGVGYLSYLLSQPHLFANKFYYSFDPVALQCLEEMLDYRQRYPQTIHQYVPNFPVTNLVWQNHIALT
ncbi:Beta-1,3-galactosyl-O-glycosyl-glycoprotein beta-1,6-N-acetylglucosaminyltransferase 3 [Holothuria leucospilota]|uniref:Beta-1,3-galactosyl-O-glycosyl-glycoprotein beta-1,6-N-acetylglucosaminyltransferase 3 n=1 Tax=Holothuria leucospilota TaxID=206669 RepID=A0A9Q1H6K7_HOLLE|nr:Beta-1,3-galactosyl-O-glycosyl-glycoprotein beta-1,6-N-acetylglucosaminyltransferase 3 [Holothuria leucospilota]